MTSGIAWAGIAAIWLAGVILGLNRKYRRSRHHHTHRVLGLTGRAQLGEIVDPQTHADAMLRAAVTIFGYVLALFLIVFGLWLVSNLVARHNAQFVLHRDLCARLAFFEAV